VCATASNDQKGPAHINHSCCSCGGLLVRGVLRRSSGAWATGACWATRGLSANKVLQARKAQRANKVTRGRRIAQTAELHQLSL